MDWQTVEQINLFLLLPILSVLIFIIFIYAAALSYGYRKQRQIRKTRQGMENVKVGADARLESKTKLSKRSQKESTVSKLQMQTPSESSPSRKSHTLAKLRVKNRKRNRQQVDSKGSAFITGSTVGQSVTVGGESTAIIDETSEKENDIHQTELY